MLFGERKLERLKDKQFTDRAIRVDTGDTSVSKDLQKGGFVAEEEGDVGFSAVNDSSRRSRHPKEQHTLTHALTSTRRADRVTQ